MGELSLSGQDLYDLMVSFLKDDQNCNMKIQCRGNSMAPFIRDKNLLTLKPVNKSQSLKNGDIVVVAIHDKKRIIIHRIITVTPHTCLVKGDNNKTSDGWFHKKDIIGVVQKIESQAGIGYSPKPYQNFVIALGSKFNVIKQAFLPGLNFLKEPSKKPMKNIG